MGGVMTKLIEANTTIPTRKSETFSTASDNQPSVEIHVLQGERPMARDNRTLGKFHLDGIPPAPRGIPQVEVTFDIDANGILNVSSKDKASGKSQSIRIEASSGLNDADIARMKQEAEANADADRKAKEEVDKLNAADAMIFQTEKNLKEFGDKLPAEEKTSIETALADLKNAFEAKDLGRIEPATEHLNSVWQAASSKMYAAAGGDPNAAPGADGPQGGGQPQGNANGEVKDVDFEEVK
jgi:molecular chaperone DnaK